MSDPVKAIAGRLQRCCTPLAALTLERSESRPWQSLLYDGARHHIRIALSGPDADRAIDRLRGTLDESDFPIPGHIIADLRLSAVDRDGETRIVSFEALTIRDAI